MARRKARSTSQHPQQERSKASVQGKVKQAREEITDVKVPSRKIDKEKNGKGSMSKRVKGSDAKGQCPSVENGTRPKGRSSKLKAVQKIAAMKNDVASSDKEEEDVVTFHSESESEDDDIDDDFELPKVKASSRRSKQSTKPVQTLKDASDSCKAEEVQISKKPPERFSSKPSEEAVLALSESDSSSDEENSDIKPQEVRDKKASVTSMPKSLFDDVSYNDAESKPIELPVKSFFDEPGEHEPEKSNSSKKPSQLSGVTSKSVLKSEYFGSESPTDGKCELTVTQKSTDNFKRESPQKEIPNNLVPVTLSEDEESDSGDEGGMKEQGKRVAKKVAQKKKNLSKLKKTESTCEDDVSMNSSTRSGRKRKGIEPCGKPSEKPPSKRQAKKNHQNVDTPLKNGPSKKGRAVVKVEKLSGKGMTRAKRKIQEKNNITIAEAKTVKGDEDADMSSDDSQSEWEEVEDTPLNESGEPTIKPQEKEAEQTSLEIDIDLPGTSKDKKRKKEHLWAAYFQWQVNKYNKERRLQLHKAHLVTLIAACLHSNRVCNDEELQCLGLSIIPRDILNHRTKSLNINFITRVVKWFGSSVEVIDEVREDKRSSLFQILPSRFETKKVATEREKVYMCAIVLRALKVDVRLVFSLQPLTYKAKLLTKKFKRENKNAEVKRPPKKEAFNVDGPEEASTSLGGSGKSLASPQSQGEEASEKPISGKAKTKSKKSAGEPGSRDTHQAVNPASKGKSTTSKRSTKGSQEEATKTVRKRDVKSDKDPTPERLQRTLRQRTATKRKAASKSKDRVDWSDDEDISDEDEHSDFEEELKRSSTRQRPRSQPSKRASKGTPRHPSRKRAKLDTSVSSIEEGFSSDSDFEVKVVNVSRPPRSSEKKNKKRSRKILSSESGDDVIVGETPKAKGSDCWLEVYLPSEGRWICVDCVRSSLNKPEMCEKMATQPVTYVIGVENDGCIKDVTRRYASKWLTATHKLRPDEEWWEETLRPLRGNKKRDKKEDNDLENDLMDKPLPTSIAEYKNHPLYALKRHLLKFEALYPEEPAILGYCRGEAVYSRECVHTLHTRETWLKEGKAIRVGEKPYKMVKPRPKWKKGEGMIKTEEAILGVYGKWQVEDYIPPPAVDGKVPRNEYGNVELFKPSMLPAGTVHLKIPGLNKVARKLDIDCVPAMMGWDFHSGFNHPVMDGFVVCKEFEEVLVSAWEEEQAEMERKAKEKREARAMKHWKLFIKSLLIRERLKKQYSNAESQADCSAASGEGRGNNQVDSGSSKSTSWPENKMTSFSGDASNLLPFEKKSRKKKK
ncbi:DNA repair protein complementing XP-C cells homolog isoform X1 [Diadema setosum]|uniref:DNA repair protein complementing XP-C cells homolog isoform X1 n=1 Tax=Diadema setosum TaxID=31175 RepID=UPI003B3AB859